MKLLIVTQKVNLEDPILGFFHRWIIEFARHCESVVVICLEEGAHELPANVKVLSLGKVKGDSSQLKYILHFYKYIWQERENYDAVFVHMNPIYVVLGGLIWKVLGKKISLWYTHKNVDTKLIIAEKLADQVFTASKEGFKLASNKVLATGHGIDVAQYADAPRSKTIGVEPITLLSVGRITPIKNGDVLIEAAHLLKKQWGKKFTIDFIGSPVTENDRSYKKTLEALISKYDLGEIVHFVGDISPVNMPERYASADVTVNLAPTGGADKVVLESMAAGVPVLATNGAFNGYFGVHAGKLMFMEGDASDLATKIMKLFSGDGAAQVGADLQKVAREKADVGMLIQTISAKLN
ncbi:MAG: hypothetical protein RLY66_565 [Candidatus Parcubacteria bacterium]|jgi:glycosyltransferase involved in cell wall biosynthesis